MFPRRYLPYALATILLVVLFYGYNRDHHGKQLQPAPAPKKESSAHACAVSPETPLKIVPCGDSITEGEGSSDYNGYRLFLYQHLMADCAERSVEFVGERRAFQIPPLPILFTNNYKVRERLDITPTRVS